MTKHKDFRGARIGLQELTVSRGTVSFDLQFLSESGLVHATAHHTLPLNDETVPDVTKCVKELSMALLKWGAKTHFDEPHDVETQPKGPVRGIAETITRQPAATEVTDDEPRGVEGDG